MPTSRAPDDPAAAVRKLARGKHAKLLLAELTPSSPDAELKRTIAPEARQLTSYLRLHAAGISQRSTSSCRRFASTTERQAA